MPELNGTILKNSANLKAYYRFESGALTTDSSGNSKTLTNNNTVGEDASGKYGGAADFGATNTNKSLSTTDALDINGGAMSMSIWVKPNTEIGSGVWDLIFQGNDTAQVGFAIGYEYNGGTRRVSFYRTQYATGTTACYSTQTLGTTNWTHLVLSYDGSTIRGYVNGAYSATVAASGNGAGTYWNGLSIACQKNLYNFASVDLDDIVVFNTALSADQIKELYEGRIYGELRPNQFGTIKALYHLSNETDFSGNNYHLTNTNSVGFVKGFLGSVADFGTSNTNKSLGIASDLGITGGAISMGGWFKMRTEIGSSSQIFVIQKDGASGNTHTYYIIRYEYNSGTRRLFIGRGKVGTGEQGINHTITLGTSNWYHLVLTYDTTNVTAYINGNIVGSPTAASGNGSIVTVDGFNIGTDTDEVTNASSIYADEVFVSSTALTANQIRQIYAYQKGLLGRYA